MVAMDELPSVFAHDSLRQDDQNDDALEDIGFFTFSKSQANPAQSALNELGLIPSPPRERRLIVPLHNDDDEGMDEDAFDLEKELEFEEMQRQEESQQPTPYFLEEEPEPVNDAGGDDIEALESNGLLVDSDSSPIATPPPDVGHITSSRLATVSPLYRPPQSAEASTSRRAIEIASPVRSRSRIAPVASQEDENIGINGLPKYIPAGLTHVALLDGSTVCFERRRRITAWRPKPSHFGAVATGLLSRPVHKIIEEVEAMRALQVVGANEAAALASERHQSSKVLEQAESMPTEMWQERYRPGRFTELIGEERTHREVLSWIKSWDKCVFGKRTAATSRKRMREAENSFRPGPNFNGGAPVYQDKWDRPRERILLLGGPAGMGKTTLAHVAAKTCGYLVHEINASDERSASTVEDRVRAALESNSLHAGKSRQPTCLILDEVDGATGGGSGADYQGGQNGGGGFIRALIKLVEQGNRQKTTNSKQKGGKKQRALLRPIICVCNDPYAPSLRALRPFSKLVRLNRPSTQALMARLRQICESEMIPFDTAGLNMLVSLCQGDVRSCLNALQLARNDARGVTAAAIEGGGVNVNGQKITSILSIKDGNSSVHQVWQRMLRTHTSRERDRQRGARTRSKNNADGDADGEAATSDSHEIVASVISSGEMDKILSGCFEHYPNLKLVDDGWWRFRQAHDWMHWYEYLNRRGWEVGMHTEMWAYLPWSFVCWRRLFANTANELPEYPRVDYQNHLMRTAFDEMMHDVQSNLPVQTRCQFDKLALTTELGPMLLPLMTPDLKPINAQVVRAEEKATLAACVNLMHSLNVDFVLDKNEQGHTYYRFDPPLEAFAHFEGKRVEGHAGHAARFNVRQLIATELRAVRVRSTQKGTSSSAEASKQQKKKSKDGDQDDEAEDVPKPKQVPIKEKCAVDFFGRPIKAKPPQSNLGKTMVANSLPESILARRQDRENQQADGGAPHIKASSLKDDAQVEDGHRSAKKARVKVFYNYHEGYSNAVRKPIKMSSFLS